MLGQETIVRPLAPLRLVGSLQWSVEKNQLNFFPIEIQVGGFQPGNLGLETTTSFDSSKTLSNDGKFTLFFPTKQL